MFKTYLQFSLGTPNYGYQKIVQGHRSPTVTNLTMFRGGKRKLCSTSMSWFAGLGFKVCFEKSISTAQSPETKQVRFPRTKFGSVWKWWTPKSKGLSSITWWIYIYIYVYSHLGVYHIISHNYPIFRQTHLMVFVGNPMKLSLSDCLAIDAISK